MNQDLESSERCHRIDIFQCLAYLKANIDLDNKETSSAFDTVEVSVTQLDKLYRH